MNFFFCQFMVLYGLSIYKKIKKEFPDKQIVFIPGKSMGDIFVYCCFKDYMFDSLNVNEDETILICAYSSKNACNAVQISNIHPIPMSSLAALSMAYNYYGAEKLDMVNAYTWCLFDYGNIQNENIEPHPPSLPECKDKILKQLSDIGCVPGKTVVLSPYEQSFAAFGECTPVSLFWEELAKALKKEGYSVCTNCKGDEKEPPVAGTNSIFPRLNECHDFLALAGASVILRSGFADFTSMSSAAIVVLYPSEQYWQSFKIWSNESFPNHHEIIYNGSVEDKAYRRELINEIIKRVKYEKSN